MRKRLLLLLIVGFCGTTAFAQSIPLLEAAEAFATAKAISDQDGGLTWGTRVYGPVLLVDPETREVVANQPDAGAALKPSGGLWVGRLPEAVQIANTATEWSGTRWTMLMWPLPGEGRACGVILAHEGFHCIQPALKLPASDAICGHLDGPIGRVWLQLEWRALERALLETGPARRSAIRDALVFRRHRRTLIKEASGDENRLELNEGLAEYTGVRLAHPNPVDRRAAAIFALRGGPEKPSLIRSFAYASGPAYGVLLDETPLDWRKRLDVGADIGQFLGRAYRIPAGGAGEGAAEAAARRYGGGRLFADEARKAKKQERRIAEMRRRFVEGPVLVLPVTGQFKYGFNPNNLVSLDEHSTVYPWLRVTDAWGTLEANGAMMIQEKGVVTRVVVPAPTKLEGGKATGDDWSLELAPGFGIIPGPRSGDCLLRGEK